MVTKCLALRAKAFSYLRDDASEDKENQKPQRSMS